MPDRPFPARPLVGPRHRGLAADLEAWAAATLSGSHGEDALDVRSLCRVRELPTMEAVQRVVEAAMQRSGARGVVRAAPVERLDRGVRAEATPQACDGAVVAPR